MIFDRLPHGRQDALVDWLSVYRSWTPEKTTELLKSLDDYAVAYLEMEMKLAQRNETDYNPLAGMFEVWG